MGVVLFSLTRQVVQYTFLSCPQMFTFSGVYICVPTRSTVHVCRWLRDESGKVVTQEGKPVLEFVSIRRRDNLNWAIPGVSYMNRHIVQVTFIELSINIH